MTREMFPAILKYWRSRRGLSQLDLALAADVSTRHISFLESGRARPSEEMVLRLASSLGLTLREQNDALRSVGFRPRFAEPELDRISPAIDWAIDRMLEQQEPYPLTVLSRDYKLLRTNRAACRIFELFAAEPHLLSEMTDMYALVFDPRLARTFIDDWGRVAGSMLARLHRETLQDPTDPRLGTLLDRVLQYPGVSAEWRHPDFGTDVDSTLSIQLRRGDLAVGFMTTVTVFSAPRLVTLEEVRLESYFPVDADTQEVCQRWASEALPGRTDLPR